MKISDIHITIFQRKCFLISLIVLVTVNHSRSQNPVIRDQFTADPSARVFNGKVYVYPSHDIPCTENRGRIGWFCMEDYHVFSSENLTDWTDHGMIVSQENVKWVNPASYSMWATDCIYKNGKYYFYFPSRAKDSLYDKGFMIGVAVSDFPEGPFIPQSEPIKNVQGIDPNVFIDKDGQAYLYWSERKIFVARLAENMLELASETLVIDNLPTAGLIEGPFMFERNGIYYLTYPHVANKTERLEYATGTNPMGPFKHAGVIMDESPTGCWTNHHSIIHYKEHWYLFYHHNDLSPIFDKNRSIRIDSLFFNEDGTIRKVIPTLRGVGITDASRQIEIDRYSQISDTGVSIAFLDSLDTFKGWKTILETKGSWLQYNGVDFGNKNFKKVVIRVKSKTGGIILIRLNNVLGPLVAKVIVPSGDTWNIVETSSSKLQYGVQNIVVQLDEENIIQIDWISFNSTLTR